MTRRPRKLPFDGGPLLIHDVSILASGLTDAVRYADCLDTWKLSSEWFETSAGGSLCGWFSIVEFFELGNVSFRAPWRLLSQLSISRYINVELSLWSQLIR